MFWTNLVLITLTPGGGEKFPDPGWSGAARAFRYSDEERGCRRVSGGQLAHTCL
jgi:hypothetical protein